MATKKFLKNYYAILGVTSTATEKEIRSAYRLRASRTHPDKPENKGRESEFKEIAEAYEILGDQERRKEYDIFWRQNFAGKTSAPPWTPHRTTKAQQAAATPRPYRDQQIAEEYRAHEFRLSEEYRNHELRMSELRAQRLVQEQMHFARMAEERRSHELRMAEERRNHDFRMETLRSQWSVYETQVRENLAEEERAFQHRMAEERRAHKERMDSLRRG